MKNTENPNIGYDRTISGDLINIFLFKEDTNFVKLFEISSNEQPIPSYIRIQRKIYLKDKNPIIF